jgi:Tol biopolymer transport system component
MAQMKSGVVAAVTSVLLVTMISAAVAQRTETAPTMLEAAKQKASVEGDLAGAIKQYQAIVDRFGKTERAVAVTALLAMGEAYQKLGDGQAQRVYERIVREFGDQKEAVSVASARLGGGPRRERVAVQRTVWTGDYVDMFGQVSPDGRLITFVDWVRSNNLMVHDTVANVDRPLTTLPSFVNNPAWTLQGSAGFSAISKDGKQVAYGWVDKDGPEKLLIQSLQAGSNTKPRQVYAGSSEIAFLKPHDWSADGRWIATAVSRKDGTGQIALIDARDGSLRALKSVGWRGPERLFFSPDSTWLAYDLPPDDETDARDIFVMAVDGSREIHPVAHQGDDRLVGWAPDGSLLLFSSDRTGAVGLWGQPFLKGKSTGAPMLLRSDMGGGISLGLTTSGALYLYKGVNDRDLRTARIDLALGQLSGPPAGFDRGFLTGVTTPDWSPDGKYLAYQAAEGDPSRAAIAIRTVATGEVRQLPGLYARDPRWSPDGQSLIAAARDRRGRNGIFRVDVQTGKAEDVVMGPGFGALPQWSPDGTRVYYKSHPTLLVERDLRSGAEREVFTHPQLGIYELAPDGQHLAVRTRGPAGANVMLVSLDGKEQRELFPPSPGGTRTMAWTPDGKSLVVLKRVADAPAELWLVPVDGGQARKVDVTGEGWTQGASGALDLGFSLSRDGRQIAFLTGTRAAEVWALENFLPAPQKR